jgi:sulfate adenylyltransferase
MGDILLGGKIDLVEPTPNPFERYTLDPVETRILFKEKGWRTVCAFQTRNVPHAGHENLQKTVLGMFDGLMIQPVIGKKKKGDFQDSIILETYDTIIDKYFAKERVVLTILPIEMRYAGPREAIHHAIMRKNYGCTHIIIGRDHAGVGSYYHPEAAIEIFRDFPDMEIQPVTIRGDFFYCQVCRQIASERTCPHEETHHVAFSGTLIRKMLNEGRNPPEEIMRPEVFAIIRRSPQPYVE